MGFQFEIFIDNKCQNYANVSTISKGLLRIAKRKRLCLPHKGYSWAVRFPCSMCRFQLPCLSCYPYPRSTPWFPFQTALLPLVHRFNSWGSWSASLFCSPSWRGDYSLILVEKGILPKNTKFNINNELNFKGCQKHFSNPRKTFPRLSYL